MGYYLAPDRIEGQPAGEPCEAGCGQRLEVYQDFEDGYNFSGLVVFEVRPTLCEATEEHTPQRCRQLRAVAA